MSSARDTLLELAGAYASSGRITAELKTNLGPAVVIYAGDDGSPSLLDALGIKAAVTIKRDGVAIAGYGDPPATEPVVAAALAFVALLVLALIVQAIRAL